MNYELLTRQKHLRQQIHNLSFITNNLLLLLHPRLTKRFVGNGETVLIAGLAEPVDAMVSNTIVRKDMPVRVRHPVQKKSLHPEETFFMCRAPAVEPGL